MAVCCVRMALAVFLLLCVWFPVSLQCSVLETQRDQVIQLLDIMVQSENKNAANGSTPNPSILLALRLASYQYKATEQQLLRRLQADAVKRVNEGLAFSSGTVALYCLGMQACCVDPSQTRAPGLKGGNETLNLKNLLENKLQEEIENIDSKNVPLTSYYQVSLDIMALCMMGNTNTSVGVERLIAAAENGGFSFGDRFSVDTASVAVLALTCVKHSNNTNRNLNNTLDHLIKKIENETQRDGLIGNLYSTGLAMQALSVTSTKMNCSTTIETVLNQARNGFFNNSMAASQITPSLENRNYLELNKLDCNNTESHLPGTMLPPTTSEKEIIVHYKVENNITEKHFNFAINVTVHEGSTLLQVMEEAKRKNPSNFSFTVEESSWGPFVTSIHGLYGNQETRTYWQFLSGKTPLDQGIDFYELKNNEDIVAEFSKY